MLSSPSGKTVSGQINEHKSYLPNNINTINKNLRQENNGVASQLQETGRGSSTERRGKSTGKEKGDVHDFMLFYLLMV